MPRDAQSQHTKQKLLEHMELIKGEIGRRMAAIQKKHKNDYDKKVRQEPQIGAGDEVYIDRPHHTTFASDLAKEFAQKMYKKLNQHTHGAYKI